VPHYLSEGISSQLVVSTRPESTAAEAYRFVVAGLDARMWQDGLDGSGKAITFVSAVPGDGKTTTVANTGLAAAQKGGRVLLIDADFGSQDLADLFIPPTRLHVGITEVVAGEQPLHKAVYDVPDSPGLHVLSRGTMRVTAPDFFASPAAQRLLHEIRRKYDLVLIDTPPLLQVAYTTTLLQASTQAVVIVPHRSSITLAKEVAERLEMVGTSLAGYIYNAAPLRRDLPSHGGSLVDILGSGDSDSDTPAADSAAKN
jgi:tyrosine-protein kinase Etk/Wzc